MKNSFLSRYLKKIIRFLGSLLFSMAIMVVLAVVLGWATFIEREFGTPAAQFLVYSSNWFYAVLGTLGLNILCSALIRFPWKRTQIPFLIAHLGILFLLIGCWQTMRFGSEAKMTVAEGTSSSRIVSASDWVFDVAVSEKGSDRIVSNVRIPFSAGPFNWADYRFDSWRENIVLPSEEKLLTRTFGQKIAKKITEWNHCAVWALARFVGSPSPYSIAVPSDFDVPSENDSTTKIDPVAGDPTAKDDSTAKGGAARNLSIDVLDYLVCADYRSVAPLKIALRRNVDGESESKKSETTDVLFDFGQEMSQTSLENFSRRAIRKTLPSGERVVFILADSDEERRNFALTAPTAAFDDSGCVVLACDGETFQFPVAELASLSQIGSTKLQLALIDYQRELIQKRLDREKAFLTEKAENAVDSNASTPSAAKDSESSSDPPESSAAETSESAPESKSDVLQTLTDDDLQRISKEVYEIQKEVYRSGDGVSEATTRSLGEKRTELSIASEIRRLEQTAKNSDDFLDRLAKILTEIDETETEIAKLDRLCSLGDSGLTISDFQLVPTLIQDVETLKGWTAQLELTNENGDKDRLQLYSELPERNVSARTFGVFGSLWTNASEKSGETRYGRNWDENLTRPRWEIVQSPSSEIDSTLYYRFWDGQNVVRCGEIPLSSPDAQTPYWSSAEIRLDSESPVADSENQTKAVDSSNSIRIEQFEPSDELGVRLVAIPFQKDWANEFYAKVRLRVRWDGQDEIFWIRTLPKDGVSPEQEKWLTKTIPGSRNDLKIALTNQTIDLGFALHIDRFRAVYEPGSTTQASFSSQMRFRTIVDSDLESESKPAATESIVVQMNRPGRFKDPKSGRNYWVYQDSFRGPFFPGDPEFERIVQGKPTFDEAIPRTRLYQTILSFNSDPGRPAKYFGALLIVLGTALLIYRKSRNGMKSDPVVRTIASCLIVSCFCASSALAQEVSNPIPSPPSPAAPSSDPESPTPSPADSPSDPESPTPSPADSSSDPESPTPSPADSPTPDETNVLFKIAQKPISETDWNNWRLLPVFDGGRIMPLNTFAILTVKEICGSANPTIFLNEKLIQELEAGNLVNLPSFDEFLAESQMKDREFDDAEKAKMKRWFDESSAALRLEHREIAEKIRRFFSNSFRKFEAFELLYYWTVFPEIWDYIPFILDDDATVSQNVLNDFERFGSGFDPRRVAPVQLDLNSAYAKRVEAILEQKTAIFAGRRLAEDEGKIDFAVANVERRLSRFRAANFNPRLVSSPLVRFYLDQILFAEPSRDNRTTIPQSLIERLDRSIKNLKELAKKEDPNVREKFESPFDQPDFFLAKTTSLANDAKSRDVLLLMRQLNLIARIYPEYPLETNVALFDRLFGELQKTREQTLRFRNEIFAASQYSSDYRQEILRLGYLLSEIVSRFELAYLALTDNGSYSATKTPDDDRIQERVDSSGKREWLARPGAVLRLSENGTLRVLSPARPLPFNNGESRRSPWLSLQTLLYAPNVMFERFAAGDRSSLNDAATLADWTDELRKIALRADEERSRLYQIQAELCGDEAENPRKIDYPKKDALSAELLYYRIDAFYWNWVCSLIALFFLIPSSILGGIAARTKANVSEKNEKRRCEVWENATFWIGLFFLIASCSIAFFGGAIRAYITGWAPVTNMFETVVLLAFLISLFTIVYVLRPFGKNPESRGIFLRRKLFLIVGTFLTFAIGLFAYYNSTEFNPNIRPLVAVLRSNFWLTIHVFAIIISYALGAIAWILSLIMLSAYIVGRYPTRRLENGTIRCDDPVICVRLSPTVLALLQSSVLFLTLGTLLGGFWADCSWGRFWSWDPKEVWALVTLLIYLTVLHGRKAGYYARFGLTIGAVLGALAIIMTWYGLSFVLGGGGRHAYTAGESNKTVVLYALVLFNIFWAFLAAVRYCWIKRKSRS